MMTSAIPIFLDSELEQQQEQIKQGNILIVEDDKSMRDVLKQVLQQDYELSFAEDGNSALMMFPLVKPDLVLLDIGLPDMSGLDVCRGLKATEISDQVSVMCVSGYDMAKDVLKAYRAGADDYTTKPFDAAVFKAKVDTLAKFQKQKLTLLEDNKNTEHVAFQSMLEASNYGEVIQFFKSTVAKESVEELVATFFNLMDSLQLSACIQVRAKQTLSLRSAHSPCSPIEVKLFNSLLHSGRIYCFNDRAVVNDKQVSILIKNMPQDEVIKGRINDILCVIIELMEEKVSDIVRREQLATARTKVVNIGSSLSNRLAMIEDGASGQLDSAANLVTELERGFDFFDLTQEQEDFFKSLLDQSRVDLDNLQSCLSGLETELTELSLVLQD